MRLLRTLPPMPAEPSTAPSSTLLPRPVMLYAGG
jgi:hypothetical protein